MQISFATAPTISGVDSTHYTEHLKSSANSEDILKTALATQFSSFASNSTIDYSDEMVAPHVKRLAELYNQLDAEGRRRRRVQRAKRGVPPRGGPIKVFDPDEPE